MLSRAILVAVAWVCLTCASLAQTLDFPVLTSRVVDEAGVLDPIARATLRDVLAELETKTTDQLVVVTLKSLRGTSIVSAVVIPPSSELGDRRLCDL